MNCRNCKTEIKEFLSLGNIPAINTFLKKSEIPKEKKYNLSVGFCPKCYLVQLIDIIPPENLFRNYVYFSSLSEHFLHHCKENAEELTKKLHLSKNSLVLEIASNDGAQLQYFKKLGIPILGIDPAKNIAKIANKKGIKTIAEFFNLNFAKKLKDTHDIQADLVFGANVLAHVPKIVDFLKGVKEILKPKGTAVFEFPYLKGLIENKFDTIYHEHVFYYSLIALIKLFKNAKLEIYDVKITKMQGGSLMIYSSHPGVFPIRKSVKNLTLREIKSGFNKLETYKKISKNILKLKNELLKVIEDIKDKGKTIAAFSAPAKGNILLNYFGINKNHLDFITDITKAKQGLYTPGTHLLVYPEEKIVKEKPDYLLILCWNHIDEVLEKMKWYHLQGGKFIIPIPFVHVL